MSYSSDSKTGIVSGSILDVLNNLTQTSAEVEVNCCTQGVVSTTKICGNGVSCETICGVQNKGMMSVTNPLYSITTYSCRVCHPLSHHGCLWCWSLPSLLPKALCAHNHYLPVELLSTTCQKCWTAEVLQAMLPPPSSIQKAWYEEQMLFIRTLCVNMLAWFFYFNI